MENHSIIFWIGGVMFAVGGLLATIGTTSTGLFIGYGVLAIAGLAIMAYARKMKDAR